MTRLLLCFRPDQRLAQPRLLVRAGQVTPDERAQLEDEVRRHYHRLVGLAGALVRFSTSDLASPAAASSSAAVRSACLACSTLGGASSSAPASTATR